MASGFEFMDDRFAPTEDRISRLRKGARIAMGIDPEYTPDADDVNREEHLGRSYPNIYLGTD